MLLLLLLVVLLLLLLLLLLLIIIIIIIITCRGLSLAVAACADLVGGMRRLRGYQLLASGKGG
jgi:hypothetical protein